MHVYTDMEEERGYCCTLRLNRGGWKRNWRRRLGMVFQVLHVKGKKLVPPL